MADIQPNKKVSEEAAAGALTATDLFRLVQGLGTGPSPYVSVAATLGALGTYVASLVPAPPVPPDVTKVAIHDSVSDAYTYVPSDAGKVVRHTGGSAAVVTIDTNANQPFSLTQVVTSRQVGAGQLTITPAGGVTLNVPTGVVAKTRAQGSVIMLHYVGTDTWDLTGDLATS